MSDNCGSVCMHCDCLLCTNASHRRPTRKAAREAIEEFLNTAFNGRYVSFQMLPDGDEDSAENKCCWAFWILESDTTSYIGEDLKIQWLGSSVEWDEMGEVISDGY